jgi:hypothetical protein
VSGNASDTIKPLEIMHAVWIISGHDKDIHLLKKARSPRRVGIHLPQECHGTLVSSWLIAMDSGLEPYAEFGPIRGLAVGIAQKGSEDGPPLLRLEVGDLVIEPVVAACDIVKEVI